jgi:hypothetical protein
MPWFVLYEDVSKLIWGAFFVDDAFVQEHHMLYRFCQVDQR